MNHKLVSITKVFPHKYSTWKITFRHVHSILEQLPADKRVVVTGLGLVCPLGSGVNYCWSKLLQGESAVEPINNADYKDIPCKVAAFVPQGEGEGKLNLKKVFKDSDFKKISLATAFALVAAEEALKDSQWYPKTDTEFENTGVVVGTGMVDLMDIVTTGCTLRDKGYKQVSPFFVPRILNNMTSGHIAMRFGFKGPNHTVSTACATGLHAIGDAYNFIRNKQASIVICGGSEAVISPLSIAGFARMRALSTNFNETSKKASRPFDKDRDGFVMGEGAGLLVIESLSHAMERDAKIYSEIIGYGLSGDAYHMTSPSADGNGAFRSMSKAISQNGFSLTDIGYINAHATSTPVGDAIELKAVHDLFGKHAKSLIVSSTKGATGHLLGAAGSVEAIFTVLACCNKTIPPNVNLDNTDVPYDVQVAGTTCQMWPDVFKDRFGLTNSFGFGGTNASLLFCDTNNS